MKPSHLKQPGSYNFKTIIVNWNFPAVNMSVEKSNSGRNTWIIVNHRNINPGVNMAAPYNTAITSSVIDTK